jgi:hypothetical protein
MSEVHPLTPKPNSQPPAPRLATSEDIPRAIEFLINFVFKWTFLAIASLLALVAVIAFLGAWPWFVLYPALALATGALLFSFTFKPKGKFHFDRHGPGVLVPPDKSASSVAQSPDAPTPDSQDP